MNFSFHPEAEWEFLEAINYYEEREAELGFFLSVPFPIKRIGLYSLDTEKLENVFMDSKARGRIFIPFGKSRVAVEPNTGI